MADHQRMDERLAISAYPEESGAFGRATPLVEIARVIRGTQLLEGKRQHAGTMRTVYQGVDAAVVQRADQALDGHDEPAWAGDVIDEHQARPLRDLREDGLAQLFCRRAGEGNFRDPHLMRASRSPVLNRVSTGRI